MKTALKILKWLVLLPLWIGGVVLPFLVPGIKGGGGITNCLPAAWGFFFGSLLIWLGIKLFLCRSDASARMRMITMLAYFPLWVIPLFVVVVVLLAKILAALVENRLL